MLLVSCFFDADLLLLLVQREGMLAVALGGRMLQVGIELYDVAGDVAQLVVGKAVRLVDLFAPLGTAGEVVQPCDVLSRRRVAKYPRCSSAASCPA